MSHTQLGATARLSQKHQLNCRIGRTISIPQPNGENPLALEMLDDIPPVHILAEAFDREFGNAKRNGETAKVLDFGRK